MADGTTNQNAVVMLDQNGNPGQVPADKVEAAQQAGYTPATKMQGPNGELGYVPTAKVAEARKQNFAVTPDNPGAARMLTKSGQVAYALPTEVDDWEKSKNAVRVNPDGSLLVPPGQSEWSQEYRDRHDTYFQAHQNPDVQKALATSDNVENTAGNTMLAAGVAGNAVVAAPVAADAGLNYLGRAALPGLEREAGKAIVKQGAKWAVKKAAVAGAGYAGVKVAKNTGLLDKILEWF
jgi:hypothetical protein